MKKIVVLATLFLAATAALAPAASTLLDGFEDTVYTTTPSPATDTITLASSTDASEGTNSLEVTVNYGDNGQWTMSDRVTKTFATPVDLTSMEQFEVDINVATPDPNFILGIYVIDEQGIGNRFLDYTVFTNGTTGWKTLSFDLDKLSKSRWLSSGRAPNLKKIASVGFLLMNENGPTTTGSYTYKLDNMRFVSGTGSLNELVIEDFESYAGDTALSDAWISGFGNDATIALNTTDPYAGGKSATLTTNITTNYTNHGRLITLAEPLNLATVKYFKMAVKGDTALAGFNPTAHIYLYDGAGNRVMGFVWSWPAVAEWSEIYMPILGDGIEGYTDAAFALQYGGSSCWRQDRWDGGLWDANADMSNITKIQISIETQAAGNPGTVNIGFDNIIAQYVAPPASERNYTVNKIPVGALTPTIDGTANAAEWATASAQPCTGFVAHDNPTVAATEDPSISAVYDDNNLYILIQVNTNSIAQTWTGPAQDDGTVSGTKFGFYLFPDGNVGPRFYRFDLIPDGGNIYTWSEAALIIGFPGVGTWSAANDVGAYSYVGDLLTIEYKLPWTDMNFPGNAITAAPASGKVWGAQLSFSNKHVTPAESVNWEPDETAGYINGLPFGSWHFAAPVATDASAWDLYN